MLDDEIKKISYISIGIRIYLILVSIYIFCKVYKLKCQSKLGLIDDISSSLRRSDTLFVLGSGASINDLKKTDWDYIAKHDSVGFNFWFVHDFVPSYYIYEESLDKKRNELFYEILEAKKYLYRDTVFLIKDIEVKNISYHKIPTEIRSNFYLAPSISLKNPFLKNSYFKKVMKYCLSFINFMNKRKVKLLFNRKASIIFIITLAYYLGYKKVVLCGIDLNNNKYFFDDVYYANKKKPSNHSNHNVHLTNTNTGKDPMKVSEILHELYVEFFRKNMELYIMSDKSELAKILAVYDINGSDTKC